MSKQIYCPRCGYRITLPRNTMSVGTKTKRQRQRVTFRFMAVVFGIVLFACLAMAATNSFPTF